MLHEVVVLKAYVRRTQRNKTVKVCGKREYERDLGFEGANANANANAKLNDRQKSHKWVAFIDYVG